MGQKMRSRLNCRIFVDTSWTPWGVMRKPKLGSQFACGLPAHAAKAETLALDALPQQLGVGLRMWILDRRDEAT